jgi:hypothetical protein
MCRILRVFEPQPGVRPHHDVAGDGPETLVVHGDADLIPLAGSDPHLEAPDVSFPPVDAFPRGSWPEAAT